MPQGDGTGPLGQGPQTGRGLGSREGEDQDRLMPADNEGFFRRVARGLGFRRGGELRGKGRGMGRRRDGQGRGQNRR